ncbi:MAG: PEGA domain-containing protein, partial [Desulfobulbaceae bacterium]|nr:PEGA domain-containing protein [Desulfobulbaceae bacterium]
PLYMSPEQIAGQGVDGRSDIFSLCVILYELTTGNRPFNGTNITAIFRAIAEGRPPQPHELNPATPRPLSELIMRGLEKFADGRPASGEVLGRDLERISLSLEGESTEELGTVRITPAMNPDLGGKGVTIQLTGHESGASRIEERETLHYSTWSPTIHDSLPGKGERPKRVNKISYPAMAGLLFMTVVLVSSGIYFVLERRGGEVVIEPPASPMVTVTEDISTKKEEPPEDSVLSQVTLPPAAPRSLRLEEPAAKDAMLALLQINSTPMGADIYVDGDFKGYTPAELNLRAAKHEVRLQLKDHLNWQAQLDLRKGGVTPLAITLLPQ